MMVSILKYQVTSSRIARKTNIDISAMTTIVVKSMIKVGYFSQSHSLKPPASLQASGSISVVVLPSLQTDPIRLHPGGIGGSFDSLSSQEISTMAKTMDFIRDFIRGIMVT